MCTVRENVLKITLNYIKTDPNSLYAGILRTLNKWLWRTSNSQHYVTITESQWKIAYEEILLIAVLLYQ